MEDGPTVLGSLWKERNNGRERDNLNLPGMRWLKFNVDGSMQGKPYVCVCVVCVNVDTSMQGKPRLTRIEGMFRENKARSYSTFRDLVCVNEPTKRWL